MEQGHNAKEARRLLSIIEEQDKYIQSKWDTMTDAEKEEYTKKKEETEETFNRCAENLNAKYKDPMRMLVRKGNKNRFSNTVKNKLFKNKRNND